MSMISVQCDELRKAEGEMPRYDGMDYGELVTAAQFSWMESARLREGNDHLKAENSKLREFATETIRLMQADGPDCGLCKHYDECWTGEAMDYSPNGCIICNEARELGIEV